MKLSRKWEMIWKNPDRFKIVQKWEMIWKNLDSFETVQKMGAAETFGGWHRVGEREVKKLGSALARHTGQEESEAVHPLWGRLAILLQRGNAVILGNRVPNFPPPQVDGLH